MAYGDRTNLVDLKEQLSRKNPDFKRGSEKKTLKLFTVRVITRKWRKIGLQGGRAFE